MSQSVSGYRVAVLGTDPGALADLSELLTGLGVLVLAEVAPDAEDSFVASILEELNALLWFADASDPPLAALYTASDLPLLALVAAPEDAAYALREGIRGVLKEGAEGERLLAALEGLTLGLAVLEPDFLRPTDPYGQPPELEPLTPREQDVLTLLAEGYTNKAIAKRLDISDHTVKFHLNAILGKLGATSRTEAVTRAVRAGLIVL